MFVSLTKQYENAERASKFTTKEAVELSLKMWTWLAVNPGKEKSESPMFDEISGMMFSCPLCHMQAANMTESSVDRCIGCPLNEGSCFCGDGAYQNWSYHMRSSEPRSKILIQEAAEKICGMLEDWLKENKDA